MGRLDVPQGQFRFEFTGRKLGEGGLGRVDEIRVIASATYDIPVGSVLACKRLSRKWDGHKAIRQRFEREITTLASMAHPGIVTLVGQSLPGGERFYVMPLYPFSLRRVISAGMLLGDWRFFAHLGAELARALAYAHDRGFIHRDIKPENILFRADARPIVADWGLGYFVHRESKVLERLTVGGLGTEYYCSLEQWSTGKCDLRGDVYSLGMTLDECIAGRAREITLGLGLTGQQLRLPMSGAGLKLGSLLRQMTAPLASGRPSSMRVVADALEEIAMSP